MSKIIKPTEEDIRQIQEEFAETIAKHNFADGELVFKASAKSDRKAKVIFKDLAWRKMKGLIDQMQSEVGWHGIAKRHEDEDKDWYIIEDILIYPQEVTGVTVTTDDGYRNWLFSQEDLNNIRMQGHSHVNMSTSPSSTDWELYNDIRSQLTSDMFYIFMIWNKKSENTIMIYDMKKNLMFEDNDITYSVEDPDGYYSFMEEAMDVVKTKPVTTVKSTTTTNTKKDNKSKNSWKNTKYSGYEYSYKDDYYDNGYGGGYGYYGYGKY